MNSTIRTPFLSQKTAAISFLADICLNFFSLLGSLVSTFTNKTQISSAVTYTV
jgi:hypothetical protein